MGTLWDSIVLTIRSVDHSLFASLIPSHRGMSFPQIRLSWDGTGAVPYKDRGRDASPTLCIRYKKSMD